MDENRGQKIFSREFIIFFAIAIPAFFAFIYFNLRNPDFFEQGVEQLHANSYVENKIGSFNSHSYFKDRLPKNPAKQAVFQIELVSNTNNKVLYLTCKMRKINDSWKLVAIKQDSINIYREAN
ncbi:MAG: hypothetical protein ACXVB0_05785 [Mucilaginibacter sp.]